MTLVVGEMARKPLSIPTDMATPARHVRTRKDFGRRMDLPLPCRPAWSRKRRSTGATPHS